MTLLQRLPGFGFALGACASATYLVWLIFNTSPDDAGARALVFVAIAATALFLAALLAWLAGWRWFSQPEFRGDPRLAIVQALPPAILVLVVAWLQSLRVLSLLIFAILVGLVVSFEYLLWPRDWSDEEG